MRRIPASLLQADWITGTYPGRPQPTGRVILATRNRRSRSVLNIQSNSNAIVWSLDANLDNNDLLVNEIGNYQGVRLMDLAFFSPQTSRYLDITATGPWTISVRSVTTVPTFDSNTAGRGDRVLLYTGPARVMRLTHDGPSNFIVWHHRNYLSASTDSDLVVNVIGPYNATRSFAAGPALIEITADGNWTIGP